MASRGPLPHISELGRKDAQKAGRAGSPKRRQRLSPASWMQCTPAGFPAGMPGIALAMEGAMQQAPQSGRQGITSGDIVDRSAAFLFPNRRYSRARSSMPAPVPALFLLAVHRAVDLFHVKRDLLLRCENLALGGNIAILGAQHLSL